MNGQNPPGYGNTFRVVTTVWLLLVSVLVAFDHAQIRHRIETHRPGAQVAELANLERKLTALEEAVSAIERAPAPVRASQFEALEQAQRAELTRIDNSLANAAHNTDIASLEQQLTRLAAKVWRLRHPLPAHPQPIAPVASNASPQVAREPVQIRPPFKVLGTELRGSEQFLTVAPSDAESLPEIRVLRPGETDGNWQLRAIEGQTAVFEVANRVERVPIP